MNLVNKRYIIGKIIYLILFLILSFGIYSQNPTLTIHTSSNESKIKLSKSYSKVQEILTESEEWKTEDDSISINLKSGYISNGLVLSGFNFHPRPIDHIHSIKLNIEGYASGKIKDNEVFLISGNEIISPNKANKNLKGKSWPDIEKQDVWTYYFDIDAQYYDRISADSFGVKLSLKNMDSDSVLAVIKSVNIELVYYPLFTFCKDELVTFFVDNLGHDYNYTWELPPGVTITSALKNRDIINVIFNSEDFGYKIVKVTAKKEDEIYYGEKTVKYNDCRISSLKGDLWLDTNCNNLKDSLDIDIEGLRVNLTNEIDLNKTNYSSVNGVFHFDSLISDYYKLSFLLDDNLIVDDTNLNLKRDYLYSTDEIFLKPGFALDTLSYRFIKNLKIKGHIWNDNNANSKIDSGEYVYSDSLLLMLKRDSVILNVVNSDSAGFFKFKDLSPGGYKICIENTDGYIISSNENNNCIDINLDCGKDIDSLNIGIYKKGEISGKLWIDTDENGLRDSTENSLVGIKVSLFNGAGDLVDTLISGLEGQYIFENIKPDKYLMKIIIPDSFDLTYFRNGDSELDSDFFTENRIAVSDTIAVGSGDRRVNIDCGFIYKKCSLGDFVWLDLNENGIQDTNESGINGIKINLYDKEGNPVDQVISFNKNNTDGYYVFENIKYGEYHIEVELPEEYKVTIKNNTNDNLNNDIDQATLKSGLFTLNPGDKYFDLDIGLVYNYRGIENRVWLDSNENGIQDSDEFGMYGIKLKLVNSSSGEIISWNKSDDSGIVHFDKIVPRKYFMEVDSLPSKYIVTSYKAGSNNELDSDFKEEGNLIKTDIFDLAPGKIYTETDLGLKINYGAISGFVWNDKNKNGNFDTGESALNNIEIQLFDNIAQSAEPVSIVFSDSEGNFHFEKINEGKYYLKFISNNSFVPVGITGDDNDITDSFGSGTTDELHIKWGENISNINGAFIANKCKIGDFTWFDENKNGLQDSGERGIENVEIKLYNEQGIKIADTTSDFDGKYLFENVLQGKYYLTFEIDNNYKFTTPQLNADNGSKVVESGDIGITNVFELSPGEERLDLDAGFVDNFASVGDMVWLDENKNGVFEQGEEPLRDIGLELYTESGDSVKSVISDSQGRYLFDKLNAGNYYIKLTNIPDTLDIESNPGAISDITGNNGINSTDIFTVQAGQRIVDMDFGFVKKKGSIGDRVWLDENNNGLQDANESGVDDIKVILYDKYGAELQQTVTEERDAQSGYYQFDVEPGDYYLRFLLPYRYESTPANIGNDRELDCDVTNKFGYNTTDMIYVAANGHRTDIDAGIRRKKSIAAGRVWFDDNKDGIFNDNESGIDSIKVYIYEHQGDVVDSTISNAKNNEHGYYEFNELNAGSYYIVFEIPESYRATEPYKTNNSDIDSDITEANGVGSTDVFTLLPGEKKQYIYAGFIKDDMSEISGRVWLDKDKNGLMDTEEKGINEVEVRLYKINGELKYKKFTSTNTKTGKDGYYSFYNIPEGKYYIQFINQIGYLFTQSGVGDNDSLNSDVISKIDFGTTDTIIINEVTKLKNINAGFVLDNHSAVGDRVWEDLNGNGIQDDGEPGINGVLVRLYKKGKGIIGSVLTRKDDETGLDGYYLFDNLSSGEYYIKVNIPGSYYLTRPDVRNNDDMDSDINDGNGYNTSGYFHLGVNERKHDVDAGAFRLGEVGDFVWLDDNENGIQEPGEKGLKFIFISIFDENGNNMGTMISDEFGHYRSKSLIPGKYYLKVLGYTAGSFTASRQGDEKSDSDITNEFGDATTSLFQILSGQFNNKIDIGILPQSQINLITYPNPVSDILQLSFNTMESMDVKIIISNIKGEKIKEIDLISNIGTNRIDVDFSDYRTGYYNVLLETGNRIPERKIFLKVK